MEPQTIAYDGRSRWSEAQRQHHTEHLRGALVSANDLDERDLAGRLGCPVVVRSHADPTWPHSPRPLPAGPTSCW